MNSAKFASLAFECLDGQLSSKQLMPKPNPVGVDDITLAIIGNLLNPPLS